MKTLSISEVRNNFTSVISDISHSHEIVVIERYGKPVASIIPFKPDSVNKNLYPLRDSEIVISKDFNNPMPELWSELAVAEASTAYLPKKRKTKKNIRS